MFKNKNLFVLKISCYKSRPNASDNAVLIVNRNESKEGEEERGEGGEGLSKK